MRRNGMSISIETQSSTNAGDYKRINTNSASARSIGYKVILSVILLVCSFAVFLLGPNYSTLFPTNGNTIYAASVSAVFLITALLFKRSAQLVKYWLIAYAFFVASMVNLVSDLFGGYQGDFLRFLGASTGTNPGTGLGKLYETLLAVIPILVLTLLSGANLRSLSLAKGNLNYKWGFGIGALLVVNYLTSVLIFFGTGYEVSKLGSVILWGLVFAFCNSMLEELWVRGLFVKKLLPLIGVAGTVLLTSIWFGVMHFVAVAYMPVAIVPIFVINTFTLGIACGILMVKTDSIWGAYLIHAAADLFLFIAMLAIH
jgi:membrane protease YdiL (CAAX protease family)